jgi:CRP-like cAMP-binding protein
MDWPLAWIGFFWGAVSAVSLPIGAVLGLTTRPSHKLISALMAFGGGALLFALSIELFGHALHVASDGHGHIQRHSIVISTMLAAVVGGLLFRGLNSLLNSKGGFRRKRALLRREVTRDRRKSAELMLKDLSRVPLFQSLPPEEIARLIPKMHAVTLPPGTTVYQEGDAGDRLASIISGQVEVRRRGPAGEETTVATLGPGEVFGEIALVSDSLRTASVVTTSEIRLLEILKEDFQRLLRVSSRLRAVVEALARERLQDLASKEVDHDAARAWAAQALEGLARLPILPSEEEMLPPEEGHGGGAAMTIWLGIALDGIPESLVIGLMVVTASAEGRMMSLAFIAGVFLANLPEALSSSATMKAGGMSSRRVLGMWMSLCVMTAVGALIGAIFFPPHPEGWLLHLVYAIEGLAGGAMLTMIAETMLPEAFEQGGGPLVGLSTLAGFLAALGVKLFY